MLEVRRVFFLRSWLSLGNSLYNAIPGVIIALITTSIILKHHYQRHKPATRRNISIKQDLFLNMAAGREDRHHGGRTKWTDKMCIDLISCREQASNIYSTDECPRKENGKKVGIMELTKRFWDNMGYSQLSKTSQNLADKYRHLQKTANIPSLLIQAEIQSQHSRQNETTPTADNNIVNTHETEVEREDSTSSIDNYDFLNGLLKLEIATEPWITIYNSVLETFHNIKSQPGNFEIRTENSFVKKTPSVKESKELDQIAVNT